MTKAGRARRRLAVVPWLLAMVCVAGAPAEATEVTLSHSAIERLVWRVLLTEGGRAYLEGGPDETCRYAFVQEPKVSGVGGRLLVRFLFSGRAGATVAGRCVGVGDTFDIVVSGVPALSEGVVRLDDLKVQAPDSPYFRLVSGLVEGQLRERLRYPLKENLDAVAAALSATGGLALALDHLEMGPARVDEEAVHLSLDVALTAR
jgi:hypothetical protein